MNKKQAQIKDEEKAIDDGLLRQFHECEIRFAKPLTEGGGDIADLLQAGYFRDQLHQRQESRRTEAIQRMTGTIRTLTIFIFVLTLVIAAASLGLLDCLKKALGL